MELRSRIDLEFADHALAGIDLFQPAHDLLGMRPDRHRRGEQLVAAGGRTRKLVADEVVHAAQLGVDVLAQLLAAGATVQSRTQHRQWRFQAVGEVGERVALAIEVLAFAFDPVSYTHLTLPTSDLV